MAGSKKMPLSGKSIVRFMVDNVCKVVVVFVLRGSPIVEIYQFIMSCKLFLNIKNQSGYESVNGGCVMLHAI